MRYQTVIEAQLVILAADAELLTLLGGAHVYARMSVEEIEQIPGVYWSNPVTSQMEETAEPVTLQWDIWAHTLAACWAIEARLRGLLHKELPATWGGVRATSQFTGSTEWPAGKRVGIYRRIMETELQVMRQRAAA